MEKEIPLLISFSGGRTSAFMTRFILTRYPKRETYVVFANTGKERLETLDFINECDKRWCFKTIWVEAVVIPEKGKGTNHKVVTYETASRNGEPFEAVIAKYGITNKPFPHCTRELKFAPIGSYMDSIGVKDYESALGIRSDEPHRINRKRAEKEKLIYPMADELKVTGKMIRDWWNNQEFDLGIKDYEGNCDMCWKKSERKLMTIYKENPQYIKWWDDMEKKYGKDRHHFFRNDKSAQDLIKLSNKPFDMAKDYNEKQKQDTMFDSELDIEFGCACKST